MSLVHQNISAQEDVGAASADFADAGDDLHSRETVTVHKLTRSTRPLSELLLGDESPEEYLERRAENMVHEYRRERSSIETRICAYVALKTADVLHRMGMEPELLQYSKGQAAEALYNPAARLYPKGFGTEITWWCHIVCAAEGRIYDPLVGKPLPADEFTQVLFGEKVGSVVYLDSSNTRTRAEQNADSILGDRILRHVLGEKLPDNIWNIRSASGSGTSPHEIELHFSLLDGKLNSSGLFDGWRRIDVSECGAAALPKSWSFLAEAKGALLAGLPSPLGQLPCVVFNAEDAKRACLRIVPDFHL